MTDVLDVKLAAADVESKEFRPTDNLRKMKIQYHRILAKDPLLRNKNKLADVAKVVGRQRTLERYWNQPNFLEWWFDAEEYNDKLELLNYRVIDKLLETIESPDLSPKDLINLSKLAVEASGRIAMHKQRQTVIDQQLQALNSYSPEQLEELLENNSNLIEGEVADENS